MKNNVLLVLLFNLVILFYCNQGDYPVEIRNEGNIEIVKNPIFPTYKNEQILIKKELTIGIEEGNDSYLFSRIRDIKVDSHGNIYVLDFKNYRIQVFDHQGKYLHSIGNKGQGPGEFMNPSFMNLSQKDHIYVSEFSRGKTICFDNNGKYIRTINLKGEHRSSNIADFYISNNLFNIVILKFRNNPKPELHPVFLEMIQVDTNGYYLKTVERFELIKSKNYIKKIATLNCEPKSVWTVDNNGNIYLGFSDKYEISVYGINGNIKRKITRKCKLVQVSELDKKDDLDGIPEHLRSKVIFPHNRPFFERFTTDAQNNLWIQRFGKNKIGQYTYDIFNVEGIYLREINLEFIPQHFNNGYVYAITETENGFPNVTKYKIEIK